jgi:hypothetical protein
VGSDYHVIANLETTMSIEDAVGSDRAALADIDVSAIAVDERSVLDSAVIFDSDVLAIGGPDAGMAVDSHVATSDETGRPTLYPRAVEMLKQGHRRMVATLATASRLERGASSASLAPGSDRTLD